MEVAMSGKSVNRGSVKCSSITVVTSSVQSTSSASGRAPTKVRWVVLHGATPREARTLQLALLVQSWEVIKLALAASSTHLEFTADV